ncbi:MAG: 30S ribosomal protein S2 [Coriobacteriia bacterium]|nr:30S ribosomal protein S2 [Coriobacteriia bacterium]
MATTVSIRSLLDAAVHFGHQTRRWNPKMKPYIFGDRNGIYIIDLKQTLIELDKTYTFVKDLAARGGALLFVGTKKQAQEAVAVNADRCGMPYVNARWLGGMLTNFVTIRSRVTYMEELEAMDADGRMAALPKKEQILLRKELGKLQTNLNGVRNMRAVPQAIFVVDTKREEIAIHEAHRLGIPVIGIIDTNADPDEVDFGIPANDDAIRSVSLLCEVIADAVIAGTDLTGISEEEMDAGDETLEPEAAEDAEAEVSPHDVSKTSAEPVAEIAEELLEEEAEKDAPAAEGEEQAEAEGDITEAVEEVSEAAETTEPVEEPTEKEEAAE